MKNIILAIFLLFFVIMGCNAQYVPSIPEATIKAVQGAIEVTPKPESDVVRVAIGNSNFSNYQYNDIAIFGTGDTQIYDNRMLIGNYGANKNIRITLRNGVFNIYTPGNKEPEKLEGPIQITSNYGLLGVSGLKRAGKQALYHGAFEIIKSSNNTFNLVNMIEIEEYLKGVVPNEMPVAFGIEALKAQSVAARNYVLRTKTSKNYDVVDSVASQVYYGANTEKPLSNQAIAETEGIVALYAQYSSTAGGYTESFFNAFSEPNTKQFPSKDRPYLRAKPDMLSQTPLYNEEDAQNYYKSRPTSYDVRSPYYRWERVWQVDELKQNLQSTLPAQSATGFVSPAFNKGDVLSNIKEIRVNKRGESGKIVELEIVTDNNTYKIQKELVIRRIFIKDSKTLPSANVVFDNIVDENGNLTEIHAYGGGYGHGVGMSQFGAGFMGSELLKDYDEILQHYYSGITLGTKPEIISGNESQLSAEQKFYAPKKYAKIIIDNKYGLDKLKVDINGREKIFDLPKEIFVHKRFCEIDISQYINKGKNSIIITSPDFYEGMVHKGLRFYIELVAKDE